jgi:hypothetical protein
MSNAERILAAVAPGPYTVYALRRHRPTICGTLRTHRWLFLAAWAWFAVHVLRGSARGTHA